jgi:hypothetical protein
VTTHTALLDGAGHATPHDRFKALKVAGASAEGAVAAGAAFGAGEAQLKPTPVRVADGRHPGRRPGPPLWVPSAATG